MSIRLRYRIVALEKVLFILKDSGKEIEKRKLNKLKKKKKQLGKKFEPRL